MIELLKNCSMVLTDSGGLQKEAFFFHKTCLTLRDQTEWVELIEAGVNQLVKPEDDFKRKVSEILNKSVSFDTDLYGNGAAAMQISKAILSI
jgi:UDP-GlcNAc3NAcA epimerase